MDCCWVVLALPIVYSDFRTVGPAGTELYIHVFDYNDGNYLKDDKGSIKWSNAATFNLAAYGDTWVDTDITGLAVKDVDGSTVTLTFPAQLRQAERYKIIVSKNADMSDPISTSQFYYRGSSENANVCNVYVSGMKDGETYYFAAQTYHRYDTVYWSNAGESAEAFENRLRDDMGFTWAWSIRNWGLDGVYYYKDTYQKNEYTGKLSNVVSFTYVKDDPSKLTTISKLKLDKIYVSNENYSWVYGFSFEGKLKDGERVQLQYSADKNFSAAQFVDGTFKTAHNTTTTFTITQWSFRPGTKYYVRARVINQDGSANDTMEDYYFGAWTNVVNFTATVGDAEVYQTEVSDKNVVISANAVNASGYEFQKKVDGKWKTIYKGYEYAATDTDVKADTTYSYRARGYYYNEDTKKTVYGAYGYLDTYTWGNKLNLVAQVASKSSVKLTWDKVNGAEGYEISRYTSSNSRTIEKSSFTNNVVVATLGSGAKSYTDKGLTNGMYYNYEVKAFKTVNGKKTFIEAYNGLYLGFDTISVYSQTQATNGKTTIKWKKMDGVAGYLLEKYDDETEEWVKVNKKIKKTATSFTFDKTPDNKSIKYRLRAYKKGNVYSSSVEIYVSPAKLLTPKSFKVSATKDGSGFYKLSWKKVKGADCYRIYTTTCDDTYQYSSVWQGYAYDGYTWDNYLDYYYTYSKKEYTLVNESEIKGTTAYIRPADDGITHYYYVVACKKIPAKEYYVDDEVDTIKSYGTKCVAIESEYCCYIDTPEVTVASAKAKKVKLTWKKIANATGYEVLRATSANGKYTSLKKIKGNKTTSYVDKKAAKGKTYFYKVRAIGVNKLDGLEDVSRATTMEVKVK